MKRNSKSPAENSSLLLEPSATKAPPNFDWIYEWTKQIQDLVEKPINIRESLLQRQQPQKCLQHSIVFSIYCTFCRKILCASCMYSSSIHRKHRIIPIESSGQQLKEDIKSFEPRIHKITREAQGLIRTNSDILLKLDRQFSPLQTQVHKFYEQMHNYMKKKQQEQLNQLKQLRDSVRSEIIEYNQKLTRFNAYINSKFQYYSDPNVKSTTILASRTILQVLLSSSTLIHENISEVDKFTFPISQEKIAAIKQQIEAKIDSMISNFHRPNLKIKSNRVKIQNQQQANRMTQPRDLTAKKHDNKSPYKDITRKNSSIAALGRSLRR